MIAAIYIGITAWVFTMILIDPDMIFGKYGQLLQKLPDWLGKPLGLCEYCLAGQLALWYYLIANWSDYNVITHIFFVSIAILTVEIINIIHQK